MCYQRVPDRFRWHTEAGACTFYSSYYGGIFVLYVWHHVWHVMGQSVNQPDFRSRYQVLSTSFISATTILLGFTMILLRSGSIPQCRSSTQRRRIEPSPSISLITRSKVSLVNSQSIFSSCSPIPSISTYTLTFFFSSKNA